MNHQEMLEVALRQSALEMNCGEEELLDGKVHFTASRPDPRARAYLQMPLICEMVSYGRGLVVSGRGDAVEAVRELAEAHAAEELFSPPVLGEMNARLAPLALFVKHAAMYLLPASGSLPLLPCPLPTRVLESADFAGLYLDQWSNALCEKRRALDRLCVGAYDGETLVGLAGASADCESMWQIGIDVDPAWRGQGIAAALTSRLALEVSRRGATPFYSCLWANIASLRNALKCGFRPAWTQISVGPSEP